MALTYIRSVSNCWTVRVFGCRPSRVSIRRSPSFENPALWALCHNRRNCRFVTDVWCTVQLLQTGCHDEVESRGHFEPLSFGNVVQFAYMLISDFGLIESLLRHRFSFRLHLTGRYRGLLQSGGSWGEIFQARR